MRRRLATAIITGLASLAVVFGLAVPPADAATRTVFSHTGYGTYTSTARTVAPFADTAVSYTVNCKTTNYGMNFLYIQWRGKGDVEEVGGDFYTRSLTKTETLLPMVSKGTFRIWTPKNCHVVVKVTQS